MMFRTMLTGAAFAALLAGGALAQSESADPATDPAADPVATAPAADPAAAPLATDPAAAPLATELTGDWVVDEGWHPADMGAISAEQMIGASVRNADGEVLASVDDLILDPDGKAESVAATFGGFLGFGSDTVLLTLDEVEIMQDDAGTVALRTALTPEDLEGRPVYEG